MGDDYQSSLAKLPKHHKNRFLHEDWKAHMMLLELFDKCKDFEPDFETFCLKIIAGVKADAQKSHTPCNIDESNSDELKKPASVSCMLYNIF